MTTLKSTPRAANMFQLVEVESVHKNTFFGFIQLLHFFAELVGDER